MKKWSIGAVAVVMTLAAAFPVHAGWEQDEIGYYYQNDSGSRACDQFMQIDGIWYFFDGTGHMAASSWYQKDGAWYYSDASGVMQTGWVLVNDEYYYLDASGAMKTGFLDLDGKRYYLDETTGVMKYSVNFVVNDRMYQAQADGSLRTNEIVESNGKMLRYNSDGTIDFKTALTSTTNEPWRPYTGNIGMELDLVIDDRLDLVEDKMDELYEEYKQNVLTAMSSSRRETSRANWEDKVRRELSARGEGEFSIKVYINRVERGYYGNDDGLNLVEDKMDELYEEYKENVLTAVPSSRRETSRANWEDKVRRELYVLDEGESNIEYYIDRVERGYYGN